MRHTDAKIDRRAVLKRVGVTSLAGAVGIFGGVEIAGATGSRAATQEVDTSLPPGAVLFDLDGDGAYDATVERAPESLADDARPNPIRITSGGRATVDYAASVVEPEGRPALGDLDRLAYDYRAGTGDRAEMRAFGVASGSAQATGQEETADGGDGGGGDGGSGGGGDSGRTTETTETTTTTATTETTTTETTTSETTTTTETTEDGEPGGGGDRGGGTGEGGGNSGNGDGGVPDETFVVVENDAGRHGAYLTYHDGRAAGKWRTHDVLARLAGDTAGTTGWFEYTADDGATFDDAIARFGADARLVRVGVGRGDGVAPTTLDATYGGLVVNDRRYRFPVEVARRSGRAPLRGLLGERK